MAGLWNTNNWLAEVGIMINESFSERLKRTVSLCIIKEKDFYFGIGFKNLEEAKKYKAMYPNKEISISGILLYEKAEEALSPQKEY